MSGDWIKIEVSLPEKPEVWQMGGILQIDPDAVVGKLLKVWRWFDAHTESGNAPGVTCALVDSLAGVTGFGEAMCMCGWLVKQDRALVLPHFARHNGKTSKTRALTAKRVAAHKEKGNADSNAQVTPGALPREEKRREEKEQEQEHVAGKPATPDCPHQQIIESYQKHLPMLPTVRVWTPKRAKALRCRWKEAPERQSVAWWDKYFSYVAGKCPFLIGKEQGSGGRPFMATFDWLTNSDNMAKVIEGNYERRD